MDLFYFVCIFVCVDDIGGKYICVVDYFLVVRNISLFTTYRNYYNMGLCIFMASKFMPIFSLQSTVPPPQLTCGAGSFLNETAGDCEPCPKGTYQPLDNQTSCTRCNEFTTTVGTGAVDETECSERMAASVI